MLGEAAHYNAADGVEGLMPVLDKQLVGGWMLEKDMQPVEGWRPEQGTAAQALGSRQGVGTTWPEGWTMEWGRPWFAPASSIPGGCFGSTAGGSCSKALEGTAFACSELERVVSVDNTAVGGTAGGSWGWLGVWQLPESSGVKADSLLLDTQLAADSWKQGCTLG